jgi:hypothetical protein
MRTSHLLAATCAAAFLSTGTVRAHPGHGGEGNDPGGLVFASFAVAAKASTAANVNQVTIAIEGDTRIIRSNGMPDHRPGQFPNRGNPHSLSPQANEFRMTTKPQDSSQLTPARGAWFGVAVNGVPFEPGTAEFWNGNPQWTYEALGGFINLGIDESNAHVQPSGAYHYHALPTGLIKNLGGDGKTMRLIGWAADGYPIYSAYAHEKADDASSAMKKMKSSYQLKQGQREGGPGGTPDGRFTSDFEYVPGAGDLDASNGRTGVTPEYPQGTYYYCITDEFPWISRSWRGTPDPSFFKQRGPGPRGGQGPGAGPGGGQGPGRGQMPGGQGQRGRGRPQGEPPFPPPPPRRGEGPPLFGPPPF